MKLLAIETAFESCSVALSLDGQVLQRYEHAPRGHAERLLPWVQALLADAGLALPALDAVAFSRGPGSFTSLRIGIGVVQGLAWGADLPVVPVSSLQATAQRSLRQVIEDGGNARACVVAMDARMDEVFAARFEQVDGWMLPVGAEQVCAPAVAAGLLADGDAAFGNGFERYPELATAAANQPLRVNHWPDAAVIAALAEPWLEASHGLPAEQAQPVYLRDKVADKPGEGRRPA
ncbi:tRNA (adenosine(37)-N6)-threonylcarbamoyltransferase complex dimerization subunit type 1 TsaB [Marinihelvus fidelis]|nr:tRNA (adenosine(37)-N6)-threonylcarbamoyltransferase complex dimerization subunit type 1 TsaB [Marinihelvus fidelis]